MILAANVQRVRKAYDLNITQTAQILGVSRGTVKRIISHTRSPQSGYNPSLRTLEKISTAFKTGSIDVILRDKLEADPAEVN